VLGPLNNTRNKWELGKMGAWSRLFGTIRFGAFGERRRGPGGGGSRRGQIGGEIVL